MTQTYLTLLIVISTLISPSLWAIQLKDDGLSPIERYQRGYHFFEGAYSSENRLYCSPLAKKKYIPESIPESTLLTTSKQYGPVTVRNQLIYTNSIINRHLQALKKMGDSHVRFKHICTGFYVDRNSHIGNAKSMGHGYLIFDYKLINNLYNLPQHKRSFWVHHFLVLHEFAHQLQYWTKDPEVIKTLRKLQNSKIPELTADCVAGALLRLANLKLSPILFNISFQGVLGATEFLGDFDKKSYTHHGTPKERNHAALFGSNYIQLNKKLIQSKKLKITSQKLIQSCNLFVKQNLK